MTVPTVEIATPQPTANATDRPSGTPRWATLLASILVDLAERDLDAKRADGGEAAEDQE